MNKEINKFIDVIFEEIESNHFETNNETLHMSKVAIATKQSLFGNNPEKILEKLKNGQKVLYILKPTLEKYELTEFDAEKILNKLKKENILIHIRTCSEDSMSLIPCLKYSSSGSKHEIFAEVIPDIKKLTELKSKINNSKDAVCYNYNFKNKEGALHINGFESIPFKGDRGIVIYYLYTNRDVDYVSFKELGENQSTGVINTSDKLNKCIKGINSRVLKETKHSCKQIIDIKKAAISKPNKYKWKIKF
ncbi:hypothetical protein KAJ89_04370 [Candidatus Parcubacteria bacterium]|nr:hypothetical protein [Candidatus Parcubacteria bacterium]